MGIKGYLYGNDDIDDEKEAESCVKKVNPPDLLNKSSKVSHKNKEDSKRNEYTIQSNILLYQFVVISIFFYFE